MKIQVVTYFDDSGIHRRGVLTLAELHEVDWAVLCLIRADLIVNVCIWIAYKCSLGAFLSCVGSYGRQERLSSSLCAYLEPSYSRNLHGLYRFNIDAACESFVLGALAREDCVLVVTGHVHTEYVDTAAALDGTWPLSLE